MSTNNSEEYAESQKEPIIGIDRQIPFREKLLLPAAAAFSMFFSTMMQMYLLYFYTSTLRMNRTYISSMFVIVQILGAVLSLLFAAYIDRHVTRWGKYKPWLLIILIGTAVGAFLSFIPVNFGEAGNYVYATVTYSIFSLFLSMNLAIRMGMTTAITKRLDDRVTIAISNSFWTILTTASVSYCVLPILNFFGGLGSDNPNGFRNVAFLFMLVFALLTFFMTRALHERFVMPIERQAKLSFKLVANMLFKNKYALIAVAYLFILSFGSGFKTIMGIYFYQYIFKNPAMAGSAVTLSTLSTYLGLFLSSFFAKRLELKKNLMLMLIVNIVTSGAVFFIPATPAGETVFYVLTAIGNLFIGIALPAQETLLPIAADYGEWKFDANCGAFLGSIYGFMKVIYSAVVRSVPVLILGLTGFARTAKQQSEATLAGIKFSVSFLPAILFILLLFIILRWDMTEERQKEIVTELYGNLYSLN